MARGTSVNKKIMNYQLLHQSIVHNRIMPRCTKIVFLVFIGVIIGYFLITGRSKHEKLKEIYKLQDDMSDILDLEMNYMAKQIFTEEDKWISLNRVEGHIYSAYLDTRPEIILKYSQSSRIPWGEIFITALLPTETRSNQLTCVLQYETTDRQTILKKVPAHLRLLNEHWNLEYSAFFIICDLTSPWTHDYDFIYDVKQLPESVGIDWRDGTSGERQFVDINYPKYGLSQIYGEKNFMAVCVPVLHHNFDRPLELIEFIEYYRMMGIDHFTFYNSSISHSVDKVLKFYKIQLLATVLDWNLPSIYIYEQTLRQQGLFAALNDCLYRNTHHDSYKYIGTFDVDEFLVPKTHDNFPELMKELDSNKSSAFLLRNVFFYTMYPDDDETTGIKPYLYTRAKTRRLKMPHKPRERSRYIVRGRYTVEIGNYNVWEFLEKELKEFVVDPNIALLHHYAPCEAEETGCYLKSIEIDKTAQRFSIKLGDRVESVCSVIFGDIGCPLPRKRIFGSE